MENLTEILKQHHLWFQGNGGRQADLEGRNLSGANLSGVNLMGADLRGALLSYTNLTGALLSYANLTGADLTGANLNRADLRGARLDKTNLNGAILSDMPLPSQAELLSYLMAAIRSSFGKDIPDLVETAGQLIGNQSAGIALIMQVLPEFRIDVLYQADPKLAIAELERVAALSITPT
ncbi:MAG: pentapeptide repeat-containing protein [Microcoleus sp.]